MFGTMDALSDDSPRNLEVNEEWWDGEMVEENESKKTRSRQGERDMTSLPID